MKKFIDYRKEQTLPSLIENVANNAGLLGIPAEELMLDAIQYFAETTDDTQKLANLMFLVENQGMGSRIGQGIGNFIGGGISGFAKGVRDGWKSNLPGQQAAPPVQNPQVAGNNAPVQAQVVPMQLNAQQADVASKARQSLQQLQNNLQQVGLKDFANYLGNLNNHLNQLVQPNVDQLKQQANLGV